MTKRTLLHIAFWYTYVLALTYLNLTDRVTSFQLLPPDALSLFYQQLSIQLLQLFIKVPFTYAALALLNRYLNQTINAVALIGWLITLLAVGAVGMSTLNHTIILPSILKIDGSEYSIFSTGSLLYHALALAFVTGIAATLKLIRWRHRTQLQVATLQKEKTEAELKYLKGQLHPHFLFNTLNNIYSLARKKSDNTAESILKLSKLMRFMLFEANKKSIALCDELSLIKDYIELEKLRYTDRLMVSYKEMIDNPKQSITPLLLIHFVENAFKHGASETSCESFINISICLQDHILTVNIANSNSTDNRQSAQPIGMDNIKRQLALIYPNHELTINAQPTTFSVTLTLSLDGQ